MKLSQQFMLSPVYEWIMASVDEKVLLEIKLG
jgi:hypothetical protein